MSISSFQMPNLGLLLKRFSFYINYFVILK